MKTINSQTLWYLTQSPASLTDSSSQISGTIGVKIMSQSNVFGLTKTTYPLFRQAVKNGLEFFTGSPVKKEQKLNEACAIILSKENADQLSNALSYNEARVPVINPITLVNLGRCPVCASESVDMDSCNSEGEQHGQCHCGTSWIEYSNGNNEDNDEIFATKITAFPQSMTTGERIAWHKLHVDDDKVIYGDLRDAVGVPIQPEGINSPHWHIDVANYRKDLDSWFPVQDELDEICSTQTTLAYWHSNRFASPYLCEHLEMQAHYELVWYRNKSGTRSNLRLYRIFKLGTQYQISVDAEISLNYNAHTDNKIIDLHLINKVLDHGLKNPMIGLPLQDKKEVKTNYEADIKKFTTELHALSYIRIELIELSRDFVSMQQAIQRSVLNRQGKVNIEVKYLNQL